MCLENRGGSCKDLWLKMRLPGLLVRIGIVSSASSPHITTQIQVMLLQVNTSTDSSDAPTGRVCFRREFSSGRLYLQ